MTPDVTPAGMTGMRTLAARLAHDPELLDMAVDASRGHSPAVAALPREETARHVRALVSAAACAFGEARPLSTDELELAARLGSDRAQQGVPIAALLDGFQAGRSALVHRLVGRLRQAGIDADVLLEAVIELDGLITALEHQLTHAHRTTELELARTASEARALLLRELLLDGSTVDAMDVARLEQQRLDPAGRYHCLVTAEHDARAARNLETALAADSAAYGGGVFGLVNGFLVGLTPRLPSANATTTTLVVAGPAVELARIPEYYSLCCAARDAGTRQGLRGLHPLADLAVMTALDASPVLGRLVADTLLGRLRAGEAFHRELAHTAMTHLERGGRLEDTANALHVHPNTVKHRLRRLREITGQRLDVAGFTLPQAARWWWALRTWLDDQR